VHVRGVESNQQSDALRDEASDMWSLVKKTLLQRNRFKI
jgi:hypothetical protein